MVSIQDNRSENVRPHLIRAGGEESSRISGWQTDMRSIRVVSGHLVVGHSLCSIRKSNH